MMTAIAARLKRVKVGTAVLLPALHNPVLLAHQVATLDQVAEGRLILGVGIAADVPNIRAEFTAAGVPFEKRVGRMMEGLRLMRALWSGKPVDWDGRWKVERAVLGPTHSGGPPGLCGVGPSTAPSTFQRPSQSTGLPLHSARMRRTPSNMRPTRFSNGTPAAVNSARTLGTSAAMPTPRMIRPSAT